ncbi:MAG: three-Cys-motif partner protein TcmP [Dolichospermum sp.]
MSNSDTKWSADGKEIPFVEQHTKTKHLLTEQYVTDLVYTLYGSGQYGVTNFTIIDGFCGGGIYNDKDSHNIWFGSPIRLIKAVQEGYLKSKRTYPLNVKFIFIDKKKDHLKCLKNIAMSQAELEYLSNEKEYTFKTEFGNLILECEFINDEFENKVDYCVFQSENRKGHSLFILDPYGWSDVSMPSFRKINSLKKSEIIYTFMVDFIKRFFYDPNWKARDTFTKVLETDGYFDIDHFRNLDTFGEQAEFRNNFMKLLRDKGNASRIMTFAMMPNNNDRVLYYLFHICSHLRALEVMKDGSWKFNNLNYQYHYDIYGFGFKAALFYEDNQLDLKLDINQDSQKSCINRLSKDLDKIIQSHPDGISFKDLCNQTMELNPATRQQYFEYLNLLRDAKEIEVIRKGKKTDSTNLQNEDIIRRPSQGTLFNLRNYIS